MLYTFFLTAGFMFAEFIGGVLSGSLSLVADATHMLSDAAALGLGLVAMYIASRPHSDIRSYGWHRAEILAALFNGLALAGGSLLIAWKAFGRFQTVQPIDSGIMLAVAIAGLSVNVVGAILLGGHRHGNLNIRGAFLHVLGDALASVGVIGAALVIRWTGWTPIDSLVSLAIAALILVASLRLVRETVSVLLESTPRHLRAADLESDLSRIPGVVGIHDLHVWTVTSGFIAFSCHAEIAATEMSDRVLTHARKLLRERYGIEHVTIQTESPKLHDVSDSCCASEHSGSQSVAEFLRG